MSLCSGSCAKGPIRGGSFVVRAVVRNQDLCTDIMQGSFGQNCLWDCKRLQTVARVIWLISSACTTFEYLPVVMHLPLRQLASSWKTQGRLVEDGDVKVYEKEWRSRRGHGDRVVTGLESVHESFTHLDRKRDNIGKRFMNHDT